MNHLATCHWSLRQLDKSVPLFEQLLPLLEAKLGRSHPNTQGTVANLGVNYKDAGRLTEAIPLLDEAYKTSAAIPTLRWVGQQLLNAYAKMAMASEGNKLINELVANDRSQLPKESPQLAGVLVKYSLSLLELREFTYAEELLRESLAIRQQLQPELWTTYSAQSMLGGALLGQEKYAEAEPLLLTGYEGMKAREETIPPAGRIRLTEAFDRLIALYAASDRPDKLKK